MLNKKQIILRITAIFAIAEYLIMMFSINILASFPIWLVAIANVFLLTLTASPLIYIIIINPYILANNELIGRIQKLILIDDLTQLGNRQALMKYLSQSLSSHARYNGYGAVLFINLDKFKNINDSYGQEAGDCVLIETAKRLLKTLRKDSVVCRAGDDEFVILLSMLAHDEASAKDKALITVQRIIAALEVPISFNDHILEVKASFGLRLVSPQDRSVDSILNEAALALQNNRTEEI